MVVVSGPEGNRAYQRDMLRAFEDNDSSDDEAAPDGGADAPADRERCEAAGMDDFVPKPITPSDLGSALERWTGTRA